jgi:glucose/arabinose dehydrogenase
MPRYRAGMTRTARRLLASSAAAAASALLLAACTVPSPGTSGSRPPTPSPSASGHLVPDGTPTDLVTGLESPWSVVRLSTGETLVSERDSGRVVRVDRGTVTAVGTVPGVVHQGEGGLLGLAELPPTADGGDGTRWLYAYETTASDNRIVRMTLSDDLRLGAPQVILRGLAKAANHDGGRIAFGPDGMLYATVGDAGDPQRAQDKTSLNGKILRMTPTGSVPDGNPFGGSLVWSMGHRNPQGLAWDADGQLFAAEFGQDTWDEFNRIEKGGNYGWPVVEGKGGTAGYIDPLAQWPTDDASPSGLAYVDGTFFLAGLGGQRLFALSPASGDWATTEEAAATESYAGEYGRLRDAIAGPDGALWLLTDNTDGRGTPRPGDDRLMEVALTSR